MRTHPRHPQFLERIAERLPDSERQDFLEALEKLAREPKRALRLNRLIPNARGLLLEAFPELHSASAVPWESEALFVPNELVPRLAAHPLVGSGAVYIQEPGAMEAVAMLDPRPGERVLDLCAAPGSKTGQIGERLGGRGWIVASDPDRSRAERLSWLTARQGLPNVSVYCAEPARLASLLGDARFDAILVDAPCSGESFYAKRRDQRADVSDREVERCARKQIEILRVAAGLLRAGGRLVYSTCTYSRDENEDVRDKFLADFPDFTCEFDSRRWPHRDGVAGGYAAFFHRAGNETAEAVEGELEFGAGLLRHSAWLWDRGLEPYIAALAKGDLGARADFAEAQGLEVPAALAAFDVSDREAQTYLRGEALAHAGATRGPGLVVWRGLPLGPAKFVEGRANNLLPKLLRNL